MKVGVGDNIIQVRYFDKDLLSITLSDSLITLSKKEVIELIKVLEILEKEIK